jgi:hypothetical protein
LLEGKSVLKIQNASVPFPALGIFNERFPNFTNDTQASRGFIEFWRHLPLALKLLVFHQDTDQ